MIIKAKTFKSKLLSWFFNLENTNGKNRRSQFEWRMGAKIVELSGTVPKIVEKRLIIFLLEL